ncbi:AIPR family protein [Actinokineospora globicatena]|uniref:AIPR family protein n=1 Tax=Actinokineospora globicatena TaxID=103729 RepID=UPI0020A41610|nr:AIPR family protein [Actinokineospora globicatena]MCP2304011.1 AIPR protein [Actinokineospora globicatena]GLW78641.1 putative abortive infection phage resistance protein [Actinokineospora globicatena]GLW84691.1 putative abortive infection phage resistance protein [Actinokineospora globicatena]
MTALHAQQLEHALDEQFTGIVKVDDLSKFEQRIQRSSFLSRSLAALAIREFTGYPLQRCAECVIDSFGDQGIDAVAVDLTSEEPQVWVAQAKWSSDGTAAFSKSAALDLKNGLELLIAREYQSFNAKLTPLVADLERALSNPRVQITLLPVWAGPQPMGTEARDVLDRFCAEYEESLRLRTLRLPDFIRILRSGIAEPQINLKASAAAVDVNPIKEPILAYHGTIGGEEIARWYEDNHHRLFQRNIRNPLGVTAVNRTLVETLRNRPKYFWYFNNGITVLCDKVIMGPRGDLEMEGASIVNGAQTVASVHEAYQRAPDIATHARIGIRIISLADCPEGFDHDVTRTTNTQNRVEPQDFIALEKVQQQLRDDFLLRLRKTYVLRRGEEPPQSKEDGCTLREAATALACAHASPEPSFQANVDINLLWDPKQHHHLFPLNRTDAVKTWRTVLILREIERQIDLQRSQWEGRAGTLADLGRLLIAHIVYQRLPVGWRETAESDWPKVPPYVAELVKDAVATLIHGIDTGYGPKSQVSSIFRNADRYADLVSSALAALQGERQPPALSAEYRAAERERHARQANAVTVIFENNALEEGTLVEFRPVPGREQQQLTPWLAADARRARATWTRQRRNCLVWAVDGVAYSPSGLVQKMLVEAGYQSKPLQGTRRWFVPQRGSLVDIANRLRQASEEEEE